MFSIVYAVGMAYTMYVGYIWPTYISNGSVGVPLYFQLLTAVQAEPSVGKIFGIVISMTYYLLPICKCLSFPHLPKRSFSQSVLLESKLLW